MYLVSPCHGVPDLIELLPHRGQRAVGFPQVAARRWRRPFDEHACLTQIGKVLKEGPNLDFTMIYKEFSEHVAESHSLQFTVKYLTPNSVRFEIC